MTDRDGHRAAMVERQIRRRGIADPAILAAFAEVPRHEFVEAAPPSDESRLVLDPADPALTVESATAIDQMTQHPPLYYAVVAAALRLVGLDDTRWDIQLLAMRMVSVLLTVLAVPFIASAVRRAKSPPRGQVR